MLLCLFSNPLKKKKKKLVASEKKKKKKKKKIIVHVLARTAFMASGWTDSETLALLGVWSEERTSRES